MEPVRTGKMKTVDLVYSALLAVLIAVCAWITIPAGEVPFTMQTFGVFCTLGLLGGKRGTASVAVTLSGFWRRRFCTGA